MDYKKLKNEDKLLVKIGDSWSKAEFVSSDKDGMLTVKTPDFGEITVSATSGYVEQLQHPAQKYAYAEAKEKLRDAYIKFETLPKRVQDAFVKGEEHIHRSSYVFQGEIKETIRAVQLIYDQNIGSRLDSQIKRTNVVKLEDAKAFNYQFTKEEFDMMRKEGKQIVFQGIARDGAKFKKLAYYEPQLNDIRTKSALSENNYFFGKTLTKAQANSLNKGEEVKITIDSKTKGKKTYLVSFNARSERFKTQSLEKKKNQSHEVSH